MDGEVRVDANQTQLGSVYSSHTLHSNRSAGKGEGDISDAPQTRRERLIQAT
jgi:hypothetical protein